MLSPSHTSCADLGHAVAVNVAGAADASASSRPPSSLRSSGWCPLIHSACLSSPSASFVGFFCEYAPLHLTHSNRSRCLAQLCVVPPVAHFVWPAGHTANAATFVLVPRVVSSGCCFLCSISSGVRPRIHRASLFALRCIVLNSFWENQPPHVQHSYCRRPGPPEPWLFIFPSCPSGHFGWVVDVLPCSACMSLFHALWVTCHILVTLSVTPSCSIAVPDVALLAALALAWRTGVDHTPLSPLCCTLF